MPGTGKSINGAARALPMQPDARFNTRTARPSTRPELLVIRELMRRLWEQLELLEPPAESELTMPLTLRDETHRFEARLIRQALAQTGGHQFRAARLLGIRPTTLHEKMKRYGIQPPGSTRDELTLALESVCARTTDESGKSRGEATTPGGSKR